MLIYVVASLALLMIVRFVVVLYADHRALDRIGKKLRVVVRVPLKERVMILEDIQRKLDEIRGASVWRRALDLTTWRASGWFEWMKEEEGK